jgi:hypothetical protein
MVRPRRHRLCRRLCWAHGKSQKTERLTKRSPGDSLSAVSRLAGVKVKKELRPVSLRSDRRATVRNRFRASKVRQ